MTQKKAIKTKQYKTRRNETRRDRIHCDKKGIMQNNNNRNCLICMALRRVCVCVCVPASVNKQFTAVYACWTRPIAIGDHKMQSELKLPSLAAHRGHCGRTSEIVRETA